MAARAAGLAALIALLGAACSFPAGGVRPGAPADTTPTTTTAPADTTTTAAAGGLVSASTLPDLSARPLDADDLALMLPPGGPGVAAGTPEAIARDNEALLAGAALDPDDEADDLAEYGRVTGAASRYPGPDYDAYAWVDLLSGNDAAHSYLLDTAGDIVKRAGGSHRPDIDLL